MSAKYHVNHNGEVGLCGAKFKCPYGGNSGVENHYDTEVEARAAYEESMSLKKLTPLTRKGGNSQSELNTLAKTADDPTTIDNIIEKAGKRALSSLSKNPNVNEDQLVRIEEKVDDKNITRNLKHHNNYPLARLTEEDIAGFSRAEREEIAKRNNLDDRALDLISKGNDFSETNMAIMVSALSNHENKLSAQKVNHLVEKNPNLLMHAKKHPNFDMSEAVKTVDISALNSILRREQDPEVIRAGYARVSQMQERENLSRVILGNKNTPSEVIDELAEDAKEKGADALLVYNNPNSSPEALAKVSTNETVVSMKKLDDLESEGKLGNIVSNTKTGSRRRNRGYTFDPAKVKEYGLTAFDVDTYVRHKKQDFLFGTQYNEETGEYTGWID